MAGLGGRPAGILRYPLGCRLPRGPLTCVGGLSLHDTFPQYVLSVLQVGAVQGGLRVLLALHLVSPRVGVYA